MREKKRCFSHDFFTRFRAHFGVAREAKTTPKRTSEHPKRLPLAKRFSGIVSGRLSDGFRSSRPSRKHAYSVFSCTLHFSAKVGKTFGKVARKDLENHAKSSRRGSRERLRSARENRTRNSSISAPFWGPRGRPKKFRASPAQCAGPPGGGGGLKPSGFCRALCELCSSSGSVRGFCKSCAEVCLV